MLVVAVLITIHTSLLTLASTPIQGKGPSVGIQSSPTKAIENPYLKVLTSDGGRFTIGTTGGDPSTPNDDNKRLLYGYPTNVGSSFTTLRIINGSTTSDYRLGRTGWDSTGVAPIAPPTSDGTTITTIWEQDGIRVEERLYFALNPDTGRSDTTAIEYIIKNNNPSSRMVGLRILLDIMIGENDGAPFFVLGTGQISQEFEFYGANVPESWIAYESPTFEPGSLKGRGQLSGSGATRPDRFVIAHWGDDLCGGVPGLFDTDWDYTPDPHFAVTCDSAVALYYNPVTLAPGQTRIYRTYYGIGRLGEMPIFGLLSLPFPHKPNENGLDRIYSFFDHEYPLYSSEPSTVARTLLKYTGERVPGTLSSCTGGYSCYSGHDGYDFSFGLPAGTPVLAAASGEVTSGTDSCGGNFVKINHGMYQTVYFHLKDDEHWRRSGYVNTGDRIGSVGSTGTCASGPHLHFAVYYDWNNDGIFTRDEKVDPYGWHDPVNPDPWAQRTGTSSGWLWNFSPPARVTLLPGSGRVLASTDGVIVNIPSGAVSKPAVLAYNIAPEPGGVSGTTFTVATAANLAPIATGHTFQLTAVYTDGTPLTVFAAPVTITVTYEDSDLVYGNEATLTVYRWEETSASWIPLTTILDTLSNQAIATTNMPGLFSLRAHPLNPHPVLLSVSPSSIKNDVETEVVITGANFLPTPWLNLGIAALDVHYVSSSTLTATVPAHVAPGKYDLILRNPDGQMTTLPNALTVWGSIYLPLILKGH